MRLSVYTYLFERDSQCYLYNSETGLFSEIRHALYERLFNEDFDSLEDGVKDHLKKSKIIVEEEKLYDYYYAQKLQFLADIAVKDSLHLTIAPTIACNFDCPYCYEGRKAATTMSDKVIDKLIAFVRGYEQLRKLHVMWYGGEPLMAFPVIKKIVMKIKKELPDIQFSQSIVTNGYLLSEEVIAFMHEHAFRDIQISLDGTEEHHNKTRCLKKSGKGTFSIIIENLKKLVEAMPPEFKVSLRINISKDNEDDFAEMYTKLKQMFPHKNVNPYPGYIRVPSRSERRMCYNSFCGKDVYYFQRRMAQKGIPMPFYPQKQGKGCMVSHNDALLIGPTGDVFKCWDDINDPIMKVGHIADKSLTNPTLICQYQLECSAYDDPHCKECLLFPVCEGGCTRLRYMNKYMGKHFDVCSYLKDPHILEECLLSSTKHKTK